MSTDTEKPLLRDIDWGQASRVLIFPALVMVNRGVGDGRVQAIVAAVWVVLFVAVELGETLVRRATLRSIRAAPDGVAAPRVRLVRRFYSVVAPTAALLLVAGAGALAGLKAGYVEMMALFAAGYGVLMLITALVSIRRMGRI